MINISSGNKKEMKRLFDGYYYYNTTQNNSKKKESFSFKMTTSISSTSINLFFGNNYNSDKKYQMSFVKQELKEYIKSKIHSNDATEKQLIQWLVNKILLIMDSCFREIVYLMHDSFTRFKIQNRDQFEQLCQHV